MNLFANITGVKYKPHLSAKLENYTFKDLGLALSKSAVFILEVEKIRYQ